MHPTATPERPVLGETRCVTTCPNCGKELPGAFPFCPFCGAALGETTPAAQREERKVVSVLFCDLVGFTAASEQADPEDVRARLRPYHAQLQQVIESHGGTVEKFVGDAVMAVFGAPVAHEDDAERAVRSGLRILEAIEELNRGDEKLQLQVRAGINTGEAVVENDTTAARGRSCRPTIPGPDPRRSICLPVSLAHPRQPVGLSDLFSTHPHTAGMTRRERSLSVATDDAKFVLVTQAPQGETVMSPSG